MNKGLYAIIGLLVVMIGLGIFSQSYLKRSAEEMLQKLNDIEISMQEENWNAATENTSTLHQVWQKHSRTWAILLDHHEMENISINIRSLEQYIQAKEQPHIHSLIAELKFWIGHIPHLEEVRLENIL